MHLVRHLALLLSLPALLHAFIIPTVPKRAGECTSPAL